MSINNIYTFPKDINRSEKWAYLLWYFVWGIGFFGEVLNAFTVRLPIIASAHVGNYVIIIVLLTGAFRSMRKNVQVNDIICYILFAMAFLVSSVMHPENAAPFEEYWGKSIFLCFPYLFLGLNINIDRMRKMMTRISFCVICWVAFYTMYYLQNRTGAQLDDEKHAGMHFAYVILPHILMCFWSSAKDKDYLNIIGAVGGFVLLLSQGNRGSIVCTLLFLLVYLVFFFQVKKKYLIFAVALVLSCIIYIYIDTIILFFQGLFLGMGMRTRIFDMLAERSFGTGDSVDEREFFMNLLMPAIKNGPIWGYGICGSWQFIGSYPHNLWYDLCITFGPLFGNIIQLALVGLIYKAFRAAVSENEKVFLLLLVITGVVKLYMSYTFLDNFETYLMIGYCLCLIRRNFVSSM